MLCLVGVAVVGCAHISDRFRKDPPAAGVVDLVEQFSANEVKAWGEHGRQSRLVDGFVIDIGMMDVTESYRQSQLCGVSHTSNFQGDSFTTFKRCIETKTRVVKRSYALLSDQRAPGSLLLCVFSQQYRQQAGELKKFTRTALRARLADFERRGHKQYYFVAEGCNFPEKRRKWKHPPPLGSGRR